ncbi:MAG: DUF1840 domain-containing protein [Rubrivivax sp.]
MIYKFKSRATGDLIMLGPDGDRMLQLLGREPAPKGIIDVEHIDAAIATLQQAMHDEEASAATDSDDRSDGGNGGDGDAAKAVSLRQRLWPMVEMLKQARSESQPVVWGV